MIAKISLAVCLIASIATVSTPMACYDQPLSLRLSNLLAILLVIGPYLLLGLMAWRCRGHQGVSVAALVLILLVAFISLSLIGYDCYHYRIDPHYRLYDRYAIPLAILSAYIGAGLLGLVTLIVWLKSRSDQKGQRAA